MITARAARLPTDGSTCMHDTGDHGGELIIIQVEGSSVTTEVRLCSHCCTELMAAVQHGQRLAAVGRKR